MNPTDLNHSLHLKTLLSILAEALDYAAKGETGCNFYDGSGSATKISYKELRIEAIKLAKKLIGLGLKRGVRIALIAETNPLFINSFLHVNMLDLFQSLFLQDSKLARERLRESNLKE